jgi:hypothetical protein
MSAPATYALGALQSLMTANLAADPMLNGSQSANGLPVPIITDQIGDLLTQLNTQVAKMGLCVLVLTPLFEFVNNFSMSLDGWALLTVTVSEDVTLNQGVTGTQIPALSAAQRILVVMHQYKFAQLAPLIAIDQSVVQPYTQWNLARAYNPGDLVTRANASWVAINSSTGFDPVTDTASLHWAVITQFLGAAGPIRVNPEGLLVQYGIPFQAHIVLTTPQP